MRFAIFGTGGIGGYFGGRLAQAGEEVTFIARGAHLDALRRDGLQVESINDDFSLKPVKATDRPEEAGAVDAVLLCTKAWSVPEAIEGMKPLMGNDTFAVWIGNGIEPADQLEKAFGRERILGGLCRISSFLTGPGHIQHVGIQPSIAFGELDHRPSERLETLRQAFARASGLKVEVPADIHVAMWEKFIFIVSVSGVGALTRQPIGVYRSIPETRAMLVAALEEVAGLGRARGVALGKDTVQAILKNVVDASTRTVLASMQRDILEGRPSELEAQTGFVVRLGHELHIPTPTHEFIYAGLLPMELKARGRI